MIQLNAHFHSAPSIRHSEWLRDQRWFIKAREDHKRQQDQRKEREDQLEDNLDAFTAAVTFANSEQIQAFRTTLDSYDTVTIKALEKNRIEMEAVKQRMEAMLDRAYVMEDGRRVFRTQDGTQAFDEYGAEVLPDELDFDLISPTGPTWEEYQPDLVLLDKLEAERADVLEYQERLDDARKRINDGDITEDELNDLQADLDTLMPETVRRQLPDYQPEQTPDTAIANTILLPQMQTPTPL